MTLGVTESSISIPCFEDIKPVLRYLKTKQIEMDNIIKTFHCPLRYQGNYIKTTIDTLKEYSKSLVIKQKSQENPQGPGVGIIDHLRLNQEEWDTRVVLFTNIRLDCALPGRSNDELVASVVSTETLERQIAKDRYDQFSIALCDDVMFAEDINPFTKSRGSDAKIKFTPSSPIVSETVDQIDIAIKPHIVRYSSIATAKEAARRADGARPDPAAFVAKPAYQTSTGKRATKVQQKSNGFGVGSTPLRYSPPP